MTTSNSSAAGNLYQAKKEPNSNTKTAETPNLDPQMYSTVYDVYELFIQMYIHHGKHYPVLTNLRPIAGIKF